MAGPFQAMRNSQLAGSVKDLPGISPLAFGSDKQQRPIFRNRSQHVHEQLLTFARFQTAEVAEILFRSQRMIRPLHRTVCKTSGIYSQINHAADVISETKTQQIIPVAG